MAVSLRALKAFKQRNDVYEVDPDARSYFGEVVMRRRATWLQNHWRWIRRQPWTVQLIILVADATVAYTSLVVGFILGTIMIALFRA